MFIEGNYLILKLKNLLHSSNLKKDFEDIANTIGMIHKYYLDVYSIGSSQLIKKITSLDENCTAKLFGICDFLLNTKGPISNPKLFAENFCNSDKMGSIVFACPEIGRFSTVGGLGVMVDELSQGLVSLGEEVWIISPYYDKNKKGESGYLANDKAKIE